MLASYLATAFAFLVLLALNLSVWRGRLHGWWLVQALFFTMLWSGYLAFFGLNDQFNPSNHTFFDIVRSAGWGVLVWRLYYSAVGLPTTRLWRNRWFWAYLGWTVVLLLANLATALGSPLLGVGVSFIAPFSMALAVLILLEQWYRNVSIERRWAIKFIALATAIMFGGDFLLFSDAFLFSRIDPVLWEARGWMYAITAPLVGVSISRCSNAQRQSRVSHQAIFFTSSLLLAGVYLVIMALAGYYLRWFGTGVGNAVQVVFVVLSSSVLVLLLTSGHYRSALMVWLNKHFLAYKYDYREQWMRANARFASLNFEDDYFEQLILSVAEPVDSVGGVAWVEDGDRFLVKAQWSLHIKRALDPVKDSSLLAFCRESSWIIDVDEYRSYPERYKGLVLHDELIDAVNIWLFVPLVHQGHLYGVLALAPPRTPRALTWEDHDLLKALGGQAAALLALRNVTESLAYARQFEAFNQLSTFVVHDIKNVVAQLSLVVRNAEKHRHNPEFIDDALDTLANAVSRMKKMLSQLKTHAEPEPRVVVKASKVIDEVIECQKGGFPQPAIKSCDAEIKVLVERERLLAALCHLVQNAQDATSKEGSVTISVTEDNRYVSFLISDTGVGMEQLFIETSLFKPFRTSKGRAGMGIGVFEARQFARDHGGELSVESEPGIGSTFTLSLAKVTQASAGETDVQGQG